MQRSTSGNRSKGWNGIGDQIFITDSHHPIGIDLSKIVQTCLIAEFPLVRANVYKWSPGKFLPTRLQNETPAIFVVAADGEGWWQGISLVPGWFLPSSIKGGDVAARITGQMYEEGIGEKCVQERDPKCIARGFLHYSNRGFLEGPAYKRDCAGNRSQPPPPEGD